MIALFSRGICKGMNDRIPIIFVMTVDSEMHPEFLRRQRGKAIGCLRLKHSRVNRDRRDVGT